MGATLQRVVLPLFVLTSITLATPSFAEEEREEPSQRGEFASTVLAPASSNDRPWDRFSARIGGFAVRFNTSAQVDSSVLGAGTPIDFEDDLNLRRDTTEGRLDGHIRFGRRHRLDYGFIAFRRSASRIIDQQIQFGDTVFDVNADLMTNVSNDLIKLAYRYDVVRRPRWDLGLSFGISAFRVDMDLSAIPAGGGGMIVAENEDFIAPIPMLGIHTDVKLSKDWYFRAGGEFFDVSVDRRQGDLTDVRAAFDWYPFEHFGFGIGFNRLRMSYANLQLPEVDITYIYSGTMIYLSYVR